MKNQDIISMLPRLENDMKLEIQNFDMKLHVQNRSKNMKNMNTKGSNSWKKKQEQSKKKQTEDTQHKNLFQKQNLETKSLSCHDF